MHKIHAGLDVRVDDGDRSREAVRWLMAAEPSVSLAVEGDEIILRSESLDRRRLEDALLCALLNEQLLAANADGRRTVMRELLA